MRNKILAVVGIMILPAVALSGNWVNYTNTDAVSQIVASGNHIWGATSGGVEALNVNTGEIIKLTNTDGLRGINAKCAAVDTSGAVWFGTADGWLSRVSSNGIVQNYAFRDSSGLTARAISIFNLKVDEDTIIWVASDIGISKFLPYKNGGDIKENARQLGNLPRDQDVVCLNVIGPNLWAGTALGLAYIDKDNDNIQNPTFWHTFRSSSILPNADIRAIASYYDTVLIGTTSGVFKLQTSPDTQWVRVGSLGASVRSLFTTGSTLLATTDIDIFQYNGVDWTGYNITGLPNGLANNLAYDSRGVLWAATPGSGLGEFTGSQWVLHSIPGPASNIIGRLAIDSVGGAWMTHDSKGLSRLVNGEWTLYNTSNTDPDGAGPLQGLRDNSEVTISVAPDGNIWVGSFGGGLYEYNWNSWAHWDTSNSPMFGTGPGGWYWAATSVYADPNNNIWVTSFEANFAPLLMGVFAPYSQDSIWQLYFTDSLGLSSNSTIILKGQDNYIWVGGNTGLNRLNDNGTPFDRSDDHWTKNICAQTVSDMSLDPAGTMWLATGTGLYYSDLSMDTVVNVVLPPSISGSVNAVASDGAGTIWVGTVAGLGLLKPNRSEPERSMWQAIYTSSNSPLLGDNITSLAVDIPTGVVYIGTNNGLSVFDSGILPPRADLTDMVAYPNPAAAGDTIAFKRVPSNGTLSIYTAAGDLVRELDLSTESTWDLKNSKGESVAGGIYFFYVRSGDASGTGKIAIIK